MESSLIITLDIFTQANASTPSEGGGSSSF